MSTLSDLLPAGASAKSITATASGAITTKKPVILNSAGTVTVVGTSPQSESLGSITQFDSGSIQNSNTVYVGNSQFCITYQNAGQSDKPYAVIATISGTTVSYGTPVAIQSYIATRFCTCYDSGNDKVVFAWDGNTFGSDNAQAIVGTVSGTGSSATISFGTKASWASGTHYPYSAVYDSTNGKVIISASSASAVKSLVATVSGTSISFGSIATGAASGTLISGCFDSTNSKIVLAYSNPTSSNDGYCVIGTVADTDISFGTPVAFTSASPGSYTGGCTYDSGNQKVVITFQDRSDSDEGKGIVGTVSSTSISFGSTTDFDTLGGYGTALSGESSQVYSVLAGKTLVGYRADDDSDKGKYVIATVTGTSISFTSPATFDTSSSERISLAIDDSGPYVLFSWRANTGDGIVYQMAADITNLTANGFLGIADAAISNSESGKIVVKGGTITGLSSLTAGSNYYVQGDGTFATSADDPSVKAGLAISTTSLLLSGDS